LQLVAQLIVEPEQRKTTLQGALGVLFELPPRDAERALADIRGHFEEAGALLTREIALVETDLKARLIHERSLTELRLHPKLALLTAGHLSIPADTDPSPPMRSVAILFAVPQEHGAGLAFLESRGISVSRNTIGDTRFVHCCELDGASGRSIRLVLAQPSEKRSHAMQALVQDIVRDVAPLAILLVGMCGGFPERGIKLLDVIAARKIYGYEHARLRHGKSLMAPDPYRSSVRAINALNTLIAEEKFGSEPFVLFPKDIATGDKKLDEQDSELRNAVLAISEDIIGIEMEAQGLYHAIWELGGPSEIMVIKGVADLGNGDVIDKELRQKQATQNAMVVALELLLALSQSSM
jgi:nucleoside phosphorylase